MKRGHRRPAGTTTKMRLHGAAEEPRLNSLIYDDPMELERGYRIVGVEEVNRPGRWNLVLERVEWDAWMREMWSRPGQPAFGIVKYP